MRKKALSGEDKNLWRRVAKTTNPLPDKTRNLESDLAAMLDLGSEEDVTPTLSVAPKAVHRAKLVAPAVTRAIQAPQSKTTNQGLSPAQPIDRPVLKKLAKGRLDVDARLDLHGLTTERARHRLIDFLELSRAAGHRIVLVITGKGLEGMGVLRQSVPHWLELPPCTHLVNGFRVAHKTHGGDGAFYVRLRRPRAKGGRGLR